MANLPRGWPAEVVIGAGAAAAAERCDEAEVTRSRRSMGAEKAAAGAVVAVAVAATPRRAAAEDARENIVVVCVVTSAAHTVEVVSLPSPMIIGKRKSDSPSPNQEE